VQIAKVPALIGGLLVFQATTSLAQPIDYSQLSTVQFKNGTLGCIDANGKVVLKGRDDWCWFSVAGIEVINRNGRYGFRRVDGSILVEPKYSYATPIEEPAGLGTVTEGGKTAIIDRTGKIVATPQVDWIWGFDSKTGLSLFRDGSNYGYLNTKGEVVIPAKYRWAWDMSDNGLAAVEIDGRRGYIDQTGKVVIPPRYDYAGRFVTGLAVVKIGEKWGYIDEAGRLAIAPQFDHAAQFHPSGYARVASDGACRIIDKTGKVLSLPVTVFAKAEKPTQRICLDHDRNGLVLVKGHEDAPQQQWYYMNMQGHRVSSFVLD